MDREQARFVLECSQAGSTDTGDPQLMQALAVMADDPEMAAWFSGVRALDAEFAEALKAIPVPESLPSTILVRAGSKPGGLPEPDDEWDEWMMGALAGIRPPDHLRTRILWGMEHGSRRARPGFWRRLGLPMAAAAGIVLALILETAFSRRDADAPLTADAVQTGFIRAYESPLFSLDERQHDPGVLFASLRKKGLPCPDCLPPGLRKLRGIGCREFSIDGKRGAVICFDDEENGAVHLVIFRLEDVDCELPDLGNPAINRQGPWVAARWQDRKNAFILVGSSDEQRLSKLFASV